MNRIQRLQDVLIESNLAALLVTDLLNVRYLVGFTGTAGAVLVTQDEAFFITDFRYQDQAANQVQDVQIRIHQSGVYQEVQAIIADRNIKQVGIEADNLTVAQFQMVQETLSALVKTTSQIVEELRQVKDQSELDLIQKACEITDEAYQHILGFAKPGLTEIQIANELEAFLKNKGASGMSFTTIVASGARGALPHGVASEKQLVKGELVTLDFGCFYQGYASDMTRTFAIGSVDDQLRKIYDIVLEAQLRVIEHTKAGMTGREIDALARDYISEKGYGDYFGHSNGHGVGLAIHEAPAISTRSNDVMVENMVITDEPGIYLPGIGGVRIEDDLVIQKEGVHVINQSPKEFITI